MNQKKHGLRLEFLIKTDIYIDPDGTVTICDLPESLVPLVMSLSGSNNINEQGELNEGH
jgi:hypothetical protein